jgi:hypothetical protein
MEYGSHGGMQCDYRNTQLASLDGLDGLKLDRFVMRFYWLAVVQYKCITAYMHGYICNEHAAMKCTHVEPVQTAEACR